MDPRVGAAGLIVGAVIGFVGKLTAELFTSARQKASSTAQASSGAVTADATITVAEIEAKPTETANLFTTYGRLVDQLTAENETKAQRIDVLEERSRRADDLAATLRAENDELRARLPRQ